MAKAKKDKIRALLKSIETGDPRPVAVVNEAKYIQHNPQTHEGSEPKLTESNRALVHSFVEAVLVGGQLDRLVEFVDTNTLTEHNPGLEDGISNLQTALGAEDENGRRVDYHRVHRVLAQGNFALCVSEGNYAGVHTAFYDLFRLAEGKLVEHWDTRESIAPRSKWKNDNGKF